MTAAGWGRPPTPQLLSGDRPIAGADATLSDLWSWSMSDLRANTVRSRLAEFLVARAMGADGRPRVEWEPYDVLTPQNLRLEVKSSAYLQAWDQDRLSRITFGGFSARTWTPATQYSDTRTYNADGYVFALQTATEHSVYDALDTDQWSFWVLPVAAVASTGHRSMGLETVRSLAGPPVAYADLPERVRTVVRPHPEA
jgi:hypothetical protein